MHLGAPQKKPQPALSSGSSFSSYSPNPSMLWPPAWPGRSLVLHQALGLDPTALAPPTPKTAGVGVPQENPQPTLSSGSSPNYPSKVAVSEVPQEKPWPAPGFSSALPHPHQDSNSWLTPSSNSNPHHQGGSPSVPWKKFWPVLQLQPSHQSHQAHVVYIKKMLLHKDTSSRPREVTVSPDS